MRPGRIFLIIVLIGVVFHTSFYFFSFTSTGPSQGISGLSVFDTLKDNYKGLSKSSKLIIIGEWVIVFLIVLYMMVREKMSMDKEMKATDDLVKKSEVSQVLPKKVGTETDIDILYKMLKDNKILRLIAISKIFKVPMETALEWCKTLESANLASLEYPTFGGPKLILEEKEGEKASKEK